ncbi:MAG: PQQ-dependent sugar dehydrogenase [Gemmatimonadaceae bacterium]
MEKRAALRLALLSLVGGIACAGEPVAVGDNSPPAVMILLPVPGQFAGGDSIDVLASATDAQQGTLGAASLDWWVVLHHGEHTHPFIPVTNGVPGRFGIPRVGHTDADIFYRVSVRATDAGGLSDTAQVDLIPRLVELTLLTQPPGLTVTLDHQPRQSPLTVSSVAGVERVIGAPGPQAKGGLDYEFARWTHGGLATQVIVADGNETLTAVFQEAGVANIPPAIALIAPAMESIVTAGDEIRIAAEASDTDGDVIAVEFFVNQAEVGVDSSAPFDVEWIPAGTGSRQLTARATDNHGAVTVAAPRTVTVQAPGPGDGLAPVVTIDLPLDGTLDLVGTVAVTASATDNVGVWLVEFYVDGKLLARDSLAPYGASLASTAAFTSGVHVFSARARDDAGNWSDWAAARVTFGGSVNLPQGFTREVYASGFSDILTAVAVSDDGRLFVAEKSGRLRVVRDGSLLPTPFVELPVLDESERGLIGVTLHPNFAVNGLVYVYYTSADGGAHNRISRFVASGDTAAGPEQVLVDLPPLSEAGKHNGGAMHFGIDGKLYVAVGDNADGSLAPSLVSTFGKMLRFNADGSIPVDNPFFGQTTGINRAIWARGLRNPFTFAIQPGTGRMHINDVGQSNWEEINLGRAGADYGWPASEGPTSNPSFDAPILAYAHSDSPTLFEGFAIVGGAFYHPPSPLFGDEYVGSYFFADYVQGWVYRLDVSNGNAVYAFAQVGGFPTGLAFGTDGAMYVLVGTRVDRIAR